jgi:hypothetical protein
MTQHKHSRIPPTLARMWIMERLSELEEEEWPELRRSPTNPR